MPKRAARKTTAKRTTKRTTKRRTKAKKGTRPIGLRVATLEREVASVRKRVDGHDKALKEHAAKIAKISKVAAYGRKGR